MEENRQQVSVLIRSKDSILCYRIFIVFKGFTYLFLERGIWRERERKKNIHVREKYPSVASHMPYQGLNPQSQVGPVRAFP